MAPDQYLRASTSTMRQATLRRWHICAHSQSNPSQPVHAVRRPAEMTYVRQSQSERSAPTLCQMAVQHTLTAVASVVLLLQAPSSSYALQGLASPSFAPQLNANSLEEETFENVPGELSATGEREAVRLGSLLKGSKHKEVEKCTRKCMPACARGGEGAPGLGPISLRREVVVFKKGFRSRQYCLSECTQVCYLSIQGPIPEKAQQQAQAVQ